MKKLLSLLATSAAGAVFLGGVSHGLGQTCTSLQLADKQDITGLNIPTQHTVVDTEATYGDLNNHPQLLSSVAAAISKVIGITVTNDDFVLTNDEDQTAKQVAGTVVNFHVKAADTSTLITGGFDFKNVLIIKMRADISSVTITDPQTTVKPNATYGDLNNDSNLLNTIMTVIDDATETKITSDDIVVTNDQDQAAQQTAGTAVKFHVQAADASSLITGGFDFTNTLKQFSKVDISNLTITDPQTYASPVGQYGQLNSNQMIIDKVTQAINQQYQVQTTASDFTITNNQTPEAIQTPGQVVDFTVTASDNSDLITGKMNFNNTLKVADISGVTIDDLNTIANPTRNYTALNTNRNVLGMIQTAISNKLGVQIPSTFLSITNDQKGEDMQSSGKVVTFTVKAKGTDQQVIGSFTFKDNLSKTDISDVTIEDPTSPITNNATYGDLNNDPNVRAMITRSIQAQTGISVTATDLTITNDQDQAAQQAAGTKVTFTVTATDNSGLIVGTFTFTDTLSVAKTNITSLVIYEYVSFVNPDKTYGDLNSDATINNMVVQMINRTYNVNCTSADFTLTNNQDPNAKQTKQTTVRFTVTANPDSSIIAGTTTFVDTLSARDITWITIPDLKPTANPDQTYGDLNLNADLVKQMVDQISKQLNYQIDPSDLSITNDQDQSGNQTTGKKVTFTISALNNSPDITGSFRVVATLQ